MEFLSYLISGISLGSVYAIIALGYTMVYGIAKMLNFAHGDVIMVGGYISFFASAFITEKFTSFPSWVSAIVSILAAVVVCTVLGILIEGLAYKPLRAASSLAVLYNRDRRFVSASKLGAAYMGFRPEDVFVRHLGHASSV